MTLAADPELRRLLIQELSRHLRTLEGDPPDPIVCGRTVHALKGAAGLAGERELASALERLQRRLRDGNAKACGEAAELVKTAIARLSAGEPAVATRWPEPPEDLAPLPMDPLVRAQYAAEVSDRLARIDEALSTPGAPVDVAAQVYRHVHTMKGAASAVGDDPMSWFCHGLEEQLKRATHAEAANALLQDMGRWRAVLGGLLDDPESALWRLRSGQGRRPSRPPRPSTRPPDEELRAIPQDGATIRIAAASVDRLLDRLEAVDLVRERVGARAQRTHEKSQVTRAMRASLAEALRLIGPPRPWGAPAAALRRIEEVGLALGGLGDELEQASQVLQGSDQALRETLSDAKKMLSAMRQTPVGRVFARLTTAIESEARRADRAVIVRTSGADETIDRRIAELLVEPCLQLVRNGVAHGIEAPEVRTALGKPPAGTITLTARKTKGRLTVTVQDDGAGVDVDEVRSRAVRAGIVTAEIGDMADDDMLLSLLFLPGFSTQDSTDMLAGRGIGLDIARGAVQRMGGSIRITSRVHEGFFARIDVPIETGLVQVMWVVAGGEEYAFPLAYVARVRPNEGEDAARTPHLAACLGGGPSAMARYALDLDVRREGPRTVTVGVDGVGRVEELLLRPLSPLVSGLGPYAGGIVRGDGALRLAIDPFALAPRARTLGNVQDRGGEGSLPPSSRRGLG